MRPDLDLRLRKVAHKMTLITRLQKVALAEEEMIDRMSDRSKKVLLGLRGKFTRAFKMMQPSLMEEGQAALEKISQEIGTVVDDNGQVNMAAVESVKSDSEQLWKTLSQASRGSSAALFFFNAFERFLTVAMLGARLQDPRLVTQAKQDPRYRDRLYKALEQMATSIPQVQIALQKAQEAIPKMEAPAASAPTEDAPVDTSALEAVQQQLNDAESVTRGVVDQLARVLMGKSKELFGRDSELSTAIENNIASIYPNKKTNPEINRNKEFYQEALHLELGGGHIDLGEFLDSKSKKALYLSYRSFVMAVRALGVLQFAKKKPEVVLSNSKAQALVVKAQEIVQQRKDTIVSFLQALRKPSKEEPKDKERGIPKGTFNDFFEGKQEPETSKPEGKKPEVAKPEAPAATRKKRPTPREKPIPLEVKKAPKQPQRKKKQSAKPEATP